MGQRDITSSKPDSEHRVALRIEVHATPNAKRTSLGGQHAGRLRVSVTAIAEKGKANRAIAELLAEAFGVSKSAVVLEKGTTSRLKQFRLENPPANAQTILKALLAGPENPKA